MYMEAQISIINDYLLTYYTTIGSMPRVCWGLAAKKRVVSVILKWRDIIVEFTPSLLMIT